MSNRPTQEYIDDLDRQMAELRQQVDMLQARKDEALISVWDIEVGDLVRNTSRRQTWAVGKVASIRPPYSLRKEGQNESYSRPWLMVNIQKKDGTFGSAERHTFGDWEKISAAEAAA